MPMTQLWIRLLHFKVTNSNPSIGPLIKEKEFVTAGMVHGKGQVREWRLIGEELSKKIKQWLRHIPKIFVKRALQKRKSIRSLWSIYILSAKMKALKIVDRDSILLIFPMIDDQKLYDLCVVLFTLLPIFFYVVRINWQFNNYIDFVNIL